MRRALVPMLASLASLTLVGCGDSKSSGGHDPELRMSHPGLTAFGTCADLETYIEDTATAQMSAWVDNGWGLNYAEDGAAEGRPAGAGPSTKGPDYSETNTQVAGVDEADFVKTDGWRTFYIVGRKLVVLRTWPADQARIESETMLDGWPQEMFLDGDRLVVFSGISRSAFDPDAQQSGYYGYYWYDSTEVQVFDVSGPRPMLRSLYYLGGSYSTSRRIGGVVRVVLSAGLAWPELQYWAQYDPNDPNAEKLAKAALKAENERRIRARSLSEWLPSSFVKAGGALLELQPDCSRYYRPSTQTSLGIATVATLDLDSAVTSVDLTSVVAEAGITYANHESLYLATAGWWGWWGWWGMGGQDDWDKTYVHKFSLTSPGRADYQASGVVRGHVIDQFSLDEHQGYLRIATSGWPKVEADGTRTEGENRVWVLGQHGDKLDLVGATPPMAPGERIYSTRFFGDKGFVVTYRQVDPLFTLDLSNPAVPLVRGQLKIPGFSTYIHLLDEGHLLTIGNDTVTSPDGREVRNGVALQIFDVTDMDHPALVAKQLVGTTSGYSEALWDHKAFNYFPKTGMLAIPFTDWVSSTSHDYWDWFQSSLKVFHVDASYGITPVGEVSHKDLYQRNLQHDWYWWYGPYIRRSVQIEDYVLSFSYAGIKVSPSADLDHPVAVLPLAPQTGP